LHNSSFRATAVGVIEVGNDQRTAALADEVRGRGTKSEEALQIFPADILTPLNLREIFGNDHPVEVDPGSGSGKFLVETAANFLDRNFLGVERLLGRIRKTRRKAAQAQLTNVRVLRLEIDYAVRSLFPARTISRFHLYFPDPWPKRKHQRRRLVQEDFIEGIGQALRPGGDLWIKTDHEEYFQQITAVARNSTLEPAEWSNEPYPPTNFEEEYLQQNKPIYRLRLVKRS
jgi:tRNA (guanine-N7-)-methyltransferase